MNKNTPITKENLLKIGFAPAGDNKFVALIDYDVRLIIHLDDKSFAFYDTLENYKKGNYVAFDKKRLNTIEDIQAIAMALTGKHLSW